MHRTFRSEDDIDATAAAIATSALSACQDPNSERHMESMWSLAELVSSSRIPRQVAHTRSHCVNAQERSDIEVSLCALLVDKCIQRKGEGWYLDLAHIAAGTSFSSWMRATAERAVLSERRNAHRYWREQHPTGEIFESDLIHRDVLEDDEECDAAVTFYKRSSMRTGDFSVHAAAAALSTGLGLEMPSRAALSLAARRRLAAELAADEMLADRTARNLLAGNVEHLDEDLVELMDTLPDEAIEQWVHHGPQIAHTMVATAVSPTPKVKEVTLRALRSAIRAIPGHEGAGVPLTRLVGAWAAWRTDVTGSKYGRGADPTVKSEEQHEADTRAFYDACVALRRCPDAPYLGASMNAIADWLERAHLQVEHAIANDLPIELLLPEQPGKKPSTKSSSLRFAS